MSPTKENVILVDIVELEDSLARNRIVRSNIDVLVHFCCFSRVAESTLLKKLDKRYQTTHMRSNFFRLICHIYTEQF